MAAEDEKIGKILRVCERQIEELEGGKSDFAYHNTRNSLHNIWTKLDASADKSRRIKEIDACLKNLERKAHENERKKFLNYYGSGSEK
ncbi:hypothetical protein BDFB_006334 [Asbolus verrucosus]|uniref:Uncharacterized protein n=1 Tax=Asbolus verrucosus TaxID=1661398 RepID=A0A482VVH6_ASBVE|nr:hypothetical protein BDFB_006334 [Asbolus verrucosus]